MITVLLKKSNADGHIQLFCQPAEGLDKFTVSGNGFDLPLLNGAVIKPVAVAPHFGEERNIGPHFA